MYVHLLYIDIELPLGLHAGGDGDSGEAMITHGAQPACTTQSPLLGNASQLPDPFAEQKRKVKGTI